MGTPDALFFDVDGVLIDSLLVKGEALADTFDDFPNSRQIVVDFHLVNGGVTRSKKIAALYRLLAGVEAPRQELDSRIARFADAARDRVVAADEITGAESAVRRWTTRCPLHAVSATPDDELKRILSSRGIRPYFRSIHGWPPAKDETIAGLLGWHGYSPNLCVLIGDSKEDLLASQRTGVRFVHVSAADTKALPGNHPTISDLQVLDSAIMRALADQPI